MVDMDSEVLVDAVLKGTMLEKSKYLEMVWIPSADLVLKIVIIAGNSGWI